MENYYMSKCQTMSHVDIMMKSRQKKKKKGLMCLQISVTNVMIPEEENAICTHTHTNNITMGIYK